MILSPEQVLQLVKDKADPSIIESERLQNDHKVHIYGTGFESVLQQIIGYENVEQFNQKKLLTKPFTRPIFKKIFNAHSRWKTAWGTSKYYHFKKNSETLSKEFKDNVLSQVWKGESIDHLIKDFLSKALYEEFSGFFLVEKPQIIDGVQIREGVRVASQGNVMPYICFKSITDVHKYKIYGNKVEFIVFKFGKIKREGNEIELFRVVDDSKDYIVEKFGDRVKLSNEYPVIDHKAGTCPVVPVSMLNKELTNDNKKTSPIDDIVQLLDYYLHQFAEHLVSEILHAHPNFFQVGQRCMEVVEGIKCENGHIQGEVNGVEISKDCPACKGTGHNIKKDASTVLILPALDQEGKPFNISNVAGYVTPPVDILTYQQSAIDWMEEKILEAATGLNNFSQSDGLEKTATGVIANMKPLEQIISDIIDNIEIVETNLSNIVGRMFYGDKFIESEIVYGRKLVLRDENSLLNEIKESKISGVSSTHLKALNEELTYSRLIRSSSDLQRNILLNQIEPLIGMTFIEVESSLFVDDKVKFLKQNFNDLIQRFENEHGDIMSFMPESDMSKKVIAINEILLSYVNEVDLGGGAKI